MTDYNLKAETDQFKVTGFDVEQVKTMEELREALHRSDKAIGAGNRAVRGFFVALKAIWNWRSVGGPLVKIWLRRKGLPDDLFDKRDLVEQGGESYLVPKGPPTWARARE